MALLERLLAAGPVSHVTLAPELQGAYELMELLSAARRDRSPAATRTRPRRKPRDAFARGAKTVTHIFNAMRPFARASLALQARRS